MHSMLSAPAETVPIAARTQFRIRGTARIQALAVLLVTLLGSALPSFAQSPLPDLPATQPTMMYLDTSTSTKWLYVSEHGDVPAAGQTTAPANGGRILRFNLTTGSTTPQVVANRGTGAGQFISPDGITMDASGNLLVADRFLNRVQVLSINPTTGVSSPVASFGTGAAGATEMRGPLGLARDTAGAIYVGEHGEGNPGTGGNVVSKWTLSGGIWTRQWRVAGDGFNTPYGVAVSGSELLVADGFSGRIQVLNTATGAVARAAIPVPGVIPLGLFLDGTSVWVAEATGNSGGTQRVVRRTLTDGAALATVGSAGDGPMQFALPFHAIRDGATNRLYVADYNHNKVQVIDLTTTGTDTTPPTVAVTGGSGTASPATFAVTFSEPVTGVTASVFTATPTGVTPGTLSVTGSGASYTVTVPFTGTSGSIALSLNASANTAIRDAANNAYAGGATSGGSNTATFTVTSSGGGTPTLPAGPAVNSIALANVVQATGPLASSATLVFTFDTAVTGVDAADFLMVGPASITSVTGSGTTWNVNFNYTNDNNAYVQLALRTSGTGITAGANAFYGLGETASVNYGIKDNLSQNPATVTSFTAGTAGASTVAFTLNFSEAVTGVDASDFVVARTAGVTSASVTGVTGSGAGPYTVTVTYAGSGGVMLFLPGGATTAIRSAATGNAYFAGEGSSTSAVATVGGGGGPTAPEINVALAGPPSGPVGPSIPSGDSTPSTTDGTDFGSVSTASGVASRTFTIQNTGTATLSITLPITLTGANAADFTVTQPPAASISAGGSMNFAIAFDPSAAGLRAATVNIGNSDANENPYTFAIQGTGTSAGVEIDLTGNGAAIADGDTTPSTADDTDFGSAVAGSGTVSKTFTIRNSGGASSTIGVANITGTNAADFTVTTQTTSPLAAGATTTFVVRFAPPAGATGVRSASVSFINDDDNENPYNFSIQGTATGVSAPEINVLGNSVAIVDGDSTPSTADDTDFGSAMIGGTAVSKTYTVQNTGAGSLTLGTVTVGGTNAADFTITTQPTATVTGGGSTMFVVRFAPSAAGARSATLSFTTNDSDENPFNFSIQGTATAPAPEINVLGGGVSIADGDTSPSAADDTDFGSALVSGGLVSRTFTIQNTGSAPLTVGTVSLSGTNAADFAVTTQPGTSVAPGGNTTFVVRFDPSASGVRTASVSFTNGDSDESPFNFAIQGTGTTTSAPEINVVGNGASIADGDTTPSTTDSTDFGSMVVGGTAVSKTFTIQNAGTATLTVGAVSVSGANAADFTVTTQPATSVTAGSSTTFVVRFAAGAAGARTAALSFTNGDTDESPYNFNIQGTGTSTTAVPALISSASAPATVNQVFSYTAEWSNSPTSTSASGLPSWLTYNATTGVLTGTPTAAGTVAVTLSATNGGGTANATLTITVNPATPPPPPPPPPPPSGGGGGGGPVSKIPQTVVFTAPVSAVLVGQPVQLGATTSTGLPITYSVIAGNATISGSTITIHDTKTVVVRATAAENVIYSSASKDIEMTASKNNQSVTLAAIADALATSGSITLNATSSAGLPITYTVSGPATISGNTLRLNGVAGRVTVTASQSGNDAYNPASASRTFNVRAVGSQVFFGKMGSDDFAAGVSSDGAKGLFIARLAATGQALAAKFKVGANGSFSVETVASIPVASLENGFFVNPTAAAGQTYTINGTLNNGVLSGTIVELNQSFTANIQPSVGSTASLAGVYTAAVPGSASGDAYIVVGPAGQAYAMAALPSGAISGTGTISSDGVVNITTNNGGTIAATIEGSELRGSVETANSVSNLVGLSDSADRTDRIVNLSSRLRVVGGDANRQVIAGFFVMGSEPKQVLIRAVGPGLSGFGVSGALSNPSLQIYSGSTLVAENNDWSNNSEVAAAAERVGAFRLNNGSQDAAILVTLAPGAYTAVVQANGGNGIALVEVYDASSGQSLNAQQLVNISTRGFVDTGDGQLIAGFVVTGNAPKRVLVRGVGPGLAQFNLSGAVADPQLKIFGANNTLIAQNDDWSSPQPLTGQIAATAADITAASTATGAFPLAANSKDAAIVITLMPGQYSAVVNGANNGTGAGLVEVYEIPNL